MRKVPSISGYGQHEFNIMLYDENSESDHYCFPPPKSEYFFQQHWESEYLLRKKNITPPEFKWSVHNVFARSG